MKVAYFWGPFKIHADIESGTEGDGDIPGGKRILYDIKDISVFAEDSEIEISEYLSDKTMDTLWDYVIDRFRGEYVC